MLISSAFREENGFSGICFLNGDALGWRGVFGFPENLEMETEKIYF